MARPKLSVTPPPEEGQPHKWWRRGDDVRLCQESWLLPGRVMGNGLCVLEGDPSSGKSTLLAHLVAAITTGKSFLERPKSIPGRVMWLSGEEDYDAHIAPRLIAGGANLEMVHPAEKDDAGVVRSMYLPACTGLLRQAVDELGLALIIIEPLVSFVPADISLNQEGPARSVVDPLNRLALETGCCVIVTRGLRKDRTGPRLSHGSGHGTISSTARSVLVVDRPDPESERRVLRSLKCVAAGQQSPPLQYHHERRNGPPKITGLQCVDGDDDAAADAVDPGERSVRADAREMLRALCATEYVPVTVIMAAAEKSGLGWRTVTRVKGELRVHSRPFRQLGQFYHEWGPPLGGWPPLSPPVRSTPCALPRKRKRQEKTRESGA